jgi:hypothetical protein
MIGFKWALIISCCVVSGCLMNSAHETHHRTAIESGQAIVVIGVGLDTASPPSSFSIALDEYSITKGKITGNCFHYNHIQANLPAVQTDVKYFAYIVPAGVYVYSSFNGNPPPHPAAFIAPSGACTKRLR